MREDSLRTSGGAQFVVRLCVGRRALAVAGWLLSLSAMPALARAHHPGLGSSVDAVGALGRVQGYGAWRQLNAVETGASPTSATQHRWDAGWMSRYYRFPSKPRSYTDPRGRATRHGLRGEASLGLSWAGRARLALSAPLDATWGDVRGGGGESARVRAADVRLGAVWLPYRNARRGFSAGTLTELSIPVPDARARWRRGDVPTRVGGVLTWQPARRQPGRAGESGATGWWGSFESSLLSSWNASSRMVIDYGLSIGYQPWSRFGVLIDTRARTVVRSSSRQTPDDASLGQGLAGPQPMRDLGQTSFALSPGVWVAASSVWSVYANVDVPVTREREFDFSGSLGVRAAL